MNDRVLVVNGTDVMGTWDLASSPATPMLHCCLRPHVTSLASRINIGSRLTAHAGGRRAEPRGHCGAGGQRGREPRA